MLDTYVRPVGDHYALVAKPGEQVLGVIRRVPGSTDQWTFEPVVNGNNNACSYVPIEHAIRAALAFEPR